MPTIPFRCLLLAILWYASCCVYNSVTGTVHTTTISTNKNKSILTYQHGVALHVSIFPTSSSGESQEYQTKLWNSVTLIWISILRFAFFFHNECAFVECNLTMHTKTLGMYCFCLSLRSIKKNIHYNFVLYLILIIILM
jgi:hypothetical protein